MNPYPSHLMLPLERRAELCAILARGVIRLRQRQSSEGAAPFGESSLHFSPDQSGHAPPTQRRSA